MFKKCDMKPMAISLFIFMLLGVFSLPAAFAGEDRRATILFTGAVRGNLDPIHT